MELQYDDSRLQALFAELEPKRRQQAIKGAFRKQAQRVRKVAINNLRASGFNTSRSVERTIRAVVFKKKAGFRVTIGTRRDKGYHINRYGKKKPVLLWAEGGTEHRHTRGKHNRKSHYTGKIQRYGFMAQTQAQTAAGVTNEIKKTVHEQVEKIALKYGCK